MAYTYSKDTLQNMSYLEEDTYLAPSHDTVQNKNYTTTLTLHTLITYTPYITHLDNVQTLITYTPCIAQLTEHPLHYAPAPERSDGRRGGYSVA